MEVEGGSEFTLGVRTTLTPRLVADRAPICGSWQRRTGQSGHEGSRLMSTKLKALVSITRTIEAYAHRIDSYNVVDLALASTREDIAMKVWTG